MSSSRNSGGYWESIGEQVLTEVERRLNSGEGKDLPGTLLMRLAELYLKHLEKQEKEKEEELHFISAMEAIDQEGLPIETKIQILTDYIEKLGEDLIIATTRKDELENDLQTLHEPVAPEGEGSLPPEA